MLNQPLLLSLAAGCCFGLWPVVARFSGLPGYWVPALIPIGTWLTVVATSFPRLGATFPPAGTAALICLGAGLINGIGMLAYGRVLGTPAWDVSKYVPLVGTMIIVSSSLAAFMVFQEPLTLRKAAGYLCAAAAIWLLR